MKTLIIIRHAKSKDALLGQSDFDRSLTKQGEEDAKIMAQKLLDKNIYLDAFVASAANRTQSTARIFIQEMGAKEKDLQPENNLYEATVTEYYRVIEQLNDDCKTVALFGHNPGVTYFINSLHTKSIHHMPPAGIYAVTIDIDSWKDFPFSEKAFSFYETVEEG